MPQPIPQTRWLKQWKFTYSSGGWEVQDQGASKVGFILRPLPWLVGGCHLIMSQCDLLCVNMERGRERDRERERERTSGVSLLMRTPALLDQGPTLTTSFNLNYICTNPWSTYSHIGDWASTYGWGTQTLSPYIQAQLLCTYLMMDIYAMPFHSQLIPGTYYQRKSVLFGKTVTYNGIFGRQSTKV